MFSSWDSLTSHISVGNSKSCRLGREVEEGWGEKGCGIQDDKIVLLSRREFPFINRCLIHLINMMSLWLNNLESIAKITKKFSSDQIFFFGSLTNLSNLCWQFQSLQARKEVGEDWGEKDVELLQQFPLKQSILINFFNCCDVKVKQLSLCWYSLIYSKWATIHFLFHCSTFYTTLHVIGRGGSRPKQKDNCQKKK